MEVMKKNNDNLNEFKTEMKSENNNLNTSLNAFKTEIKSEMNNKFEQQNTSLDEFKTEMKSENNKLNTSLNEYKIEIKSEVNASNIELKTEIKKQNEKLREINNKLEEQNKTIVGMKGDITININKIQDEINESRTLKEEVENDTVTGERNENKNNEGRNTKVSDEFKTSGNYDDIVKNCLLYTSRCV